MPSITSDATRTCSVMKRPFLFLPSGAARTSPVLLKADDLNRAEDRISGMMQPLQNFELFASWRLPPKWQIVCTANPEGGDYSITYMDGAMLTRMLHFTMKFEPAPWAEWAKRKGVRKESINFVLSYPEILQGRRTTPRSLTQFFWQIQ